MPKSRKERSSSTPGRTKGSNCQKSDLKNLHANDTKLYKTNPKLWFKCCDAVDSEKGNRPGVHTHF